MTIYENALSSTVINEETGATLRVCEGTDPDTGEKYYFVERDLTLNDLSQLFRYRKEGVPAHVLAGLTGRARMWATRVSWALEYMVETDTEPCYFEL